MSKLSYRPEVDGLRALAVIPVVLFHLNADWLPGGYLGVDVFFVISGFLITAILQREMQEGTFRFRDFWTRRVKRIAPALLAMIAVVLLLCPFLLFLPKVHSVGTDGLAAIFSYANVWMFVQAGDYWGDAAESSPFLHTWSLSLEEQFYFVYPFLLWATIKLRANVGKVLMALIAISFLCFSLGVLTHPTATFYLLPTRAWELALGGLAAYFHGNRQAIVSQTTSAILAGIGLAGIVVSYGLELTSSSISHVAVLPVVGSALFIFFSNAQSWPGRLLSWHPVVFVGKISYSLYLWHWPVIVLAKAYYQRPLDLPGYLCVVLMTIILTLCSYLWVEIPTRRLANPYPRFLVQLCASVLLCGVGMQLGMQWKYPSSFADVQFHGLYYDVTPVIGEVSTANQLKREGIVAPTRPAEFGDAFRMNGIPGGDLSRHAPSVVILGDSHGAMWAKSIDSVCTQLGHRAAFFTTVGNNPFFDIPVTGNAKPKTGFTQDEFDLMHNNILQKISQWQPTVIVVCCRWTRMQDVDFRRAERLVEYASQQGANVLVFEQPPEVPIGNNNSAQYLAFLGLQPNGDQPLFLRQPESHDSAAARLRVSQLCERHANAFLFPVFDRFQHGDRALVAVGDSILYYDDDHLSTQATELFASKLADRIDRFHGQQPTATKPLFADRSGDEMRR